MAERYLERIIGRMIDINYHILSQKKNEIPADFYSSFPVCETGWRMNMTRLTLKKFSPSSGLAWKMFQNI